MINDLGKITDYITKNAVELNFIYETFDVKSSLDK